MQAIVSIHQMVSRPSDYSSRLHIPVKPMRSCTQRPSRRDWAQKAFSYSLSEILYLNRPVSLTA